MYYEGGAIDEENHLWRSDQQAYNNYNFTSAQHSTIHSDGNIALGHVRRSTSDFTQSYPNPHPFIYPYNEEWSGKQFSFIHNGSVDKDRLRTFLTDDWLDNHPPDTHGNGSWDGDGWDYIVDSELYFFWIMKNIEEANGNIMIGLKHALYALENDYIAGSEDKNFIFSDGIDLYAYRSTSDDYHPLKYCTGEVEVTGPNGIILQQNHKAVMSTVPGGFPVAYQGWIEIGDMELVFLPADGDIVVFPMFCYRAVILANRHYGDPTSNLGGTLNLYNIDTPEMNALDVESGISVPVIYGDRYTVQTNSEILQGKKHIIWNEIDSDYLLIKSDFEMTGELAELGLSAYFHFVNEVNNESEQPIKIQDPWYVRDDGTQTGVDWVEFDDVYYVFLNRNSYFVEDAPVYSLKAPQYYADLYGIYEFTNWFGTDIDFGNGENEPTTDRETDVVFMSGGAEVSADYDFLTAEGNLVQNTSNWNIVGLPRTVEDDHYFTLFPNSIEGTCLRYENGYYVSESNLTSGEGYWLRFSESGENVIIGEEITELTFDLTEGWQLISGISETVPISYIFDPDHIIIRGTIMDYNNQVVGELVPGKGYWVRANQPGTITITNRPSSPILFTSLIEDANYVKFTNDTGKEKTVYFGVDVPEEDQLSYTLPPLPPDVVMEENFLDVRYTNNYTYTEATGTIEVRNTDYPLTVEYGILSDNGEWEISSNAPKRRRGDEEYGDIGRVKLSRTGTIVVEHPIESFTIRKTSVNNLPTEFALSQNYPNPFNPITTIMYDVPKESHVTLTVYDLMGRVVRELVSDKIIAGTHNIIWNGTDAHGQPVASGMYLYQLKTDNFMITKKLVLLK